MSFPITAKWTATDESPTGESYTDHYDLVANDGSLVGSVASYRSTDGYSFTVEGIAETDDWPEHYDASFGETEFAATAISECLGFSSPVILTVMYGQAR